MLRHLKTMLIVLTCIIINAIVASLMDTEPAFGLACTALYMVIYNELGGKQQ